MMLSGSGGDLLLGGDATTQTCQWKIAMFDDCFIRDLVYYPRGIKFSSFYTDEGIASSLWNLRRGQQEDLRKCWARRHFTDYLPKELVDHTYKADFWGLYMDGLEENKQTLLRLEEEAYDLTRMEHFRTNRLRPLLDARNTECDMEINQTIEARAAAIAWTVSLKRYPNSVPELP